MAEPSNITVLKKLYSKIAEVSLGSAEATTGQNYLTLCNPGILLNPKLETSTNVQAQQILASILDGVPVPNWIYSPSGETVSSIFKQILRGKELPSVKPTAQQAEELEKAREVVMDSEGNKSKKFKSFQAYRKAYVAILMAYESARTTAANEGKSVSREDLSEVNEARSEWDTFGYKGEVEGAMAKIANLQQLDPNTWWKELEANFANVAQNASGVDFEPSTTYPDYPTFFGESGWTSFTFTDTDATNQGSSAAVEAGGGVEAGWGLWRVSSSANYSTDTETRSSDTGGVSVSMDLMRASINRLWLDPLVFRAHTWRLSKASSLYKQKISNGSFLPGEPNPDARMPLLPIGILVARNVQIKGSFSHEDQTEIQSKLEAGGSVGWGPFSLQGHYSQSNESDLSHASMTETSIANADPQIIGFLCNVLPMSPNPDESLPWSE